MDKLIEKYYEKFAGLPNKYPIVRNGIREDAFTLAVLDILYPDFLDIKLTISNINNISRVIVAPPDSGIDIFIEFEDGDEFYYHIIQCKYSKLNQSKIRDCFAIMKSSINDYLKNPNLVQKNLRDVISNTNFEDSYKNKCTYFVVHTGIINYCDTVHKDQKIVNLNDLNILKNSVKNSKVPHFEFNADSFRSNIKYDEFIDSDNALLCNLRGYELAQLNNKYINTSRGRNILFGLNLRDSLSSKSKTYAEMINTINTEPNRFWHYNNGITIIAEKFKVDKDKEKNIKSIKLTNFSIINGAQTTSTLGTYLRDAETFLNEDSIEKLKKVYVLARIMEVKDKSFGENISIYNNLQNPICSRDLVSNRNEQLMLQRTLLEGKPYIFVNIRRGEDCPTHIKLYKHQNTNNEELAQLAFCAFLSSPFQAKDKKRTLFNRDYSDEDVLINKHYHQIFCYPNEKYAGILFIKSKKEIDEALFIKELYKLSKNHFRKRYEQKIEETYDKLQNEKVELDSTINEKIKTYQKYKEISSTCMFYCITLYFEIKREFEKNGEIEKGFDYESFYKGKNSSYKKDIINYFADNFLSKTIEIISNSLDGITNVANWVRKSSSQDVFLKALNNETARDQKIENLYVDFVKKFKK